MPDSADLLESGLKQAFYNAAVTLRAWKSGGPEPNVPLSQKLYSISAVCRFVLACENEDMPDHLVDVMDRLPDRTRTDLLEYLCKDWSYHAGARCLLEMVADRKKRHGIAD